MFTVDWLEITLVPQYNVGAASGAAGAAYSFTPISVLWAPDILPGGVSSNRNDLLSQEDVRIDLLDKVISMRCMKPSPLLPAYVGVSGVYVVPETTQWLFTGNSAVLGTGSGSSVRWSGIPAFLTNHGTEGVTCEAYCKVQCRLKEQQS